MEADLVSRALLGASPALIAIAIRGGCPALCRLPCVAAGCLAWPLLPANASPATRLTSQDTREALGERGEKLAQLQDKTAALEESAQSFAEMAKRMAAQNQNKKWWQL
jgi:hypothetical protein